jgi:4-alpha-glucanotransferase
MLIQFQIEYKTFFGQQLMITGSHIALGLGVKEKAIPMKIIDPTEGIWICSVNIEPGETFSYRYFVKEENIAATLEEWGPDRIFNESGINCRNKLQIDFWRSMADPDYALFSSAFKNAIFRNNTTYAIPELHESKVNGQVTIRFKPSLCRLKNGDRLAVCGNIKPLGTWDDENALLLGNPGHPEWEAEILADKKDFPVYYKYIIKNDKGETEFWEKSAERVLYLPDNFVPDVVEICNEKFDFPRYSWKGAGVAIPVFSLRRDEGFGVGEFTDLKLLVDWAQKVGLSMIQILPVNDTVATHTWQDSYPYAAISVFALHPIYINLKQIGSLNSDITARIIEEQGKYLNNIEKIDYEAVMALKSRYFKLIYDQKKNEFLNDPAFIKFFETNKFWLKPYAAFSYLRDLFNTPDFNRWGEFSKPGLEIMNQLTHNDSHHFDDIAVHYFIQYQAHIQLIDAADYARSKGIALKGDIPIGIYRNSVDAWLYPDFFHMDCQAGAPPDDFSNIGQNWRFPTYNWEEMAKDNYNWWKQRLQQMATYFDAFRIDHILGFFRIWEIPDKQVEGLMGYFNPSLPYSREELQQLGLYFDMERFCEPYIKEYFLEERFGDLTELVKSKYLKETSPGFYMLKPGFDTQRKVENHLSPGPETNEEERNQMLRIKKGLYSLISEVIFLEAPGTDGKGWYPRNALHYTKSYQELDYHSQKAINDIYIDYFYRRNEDFWKEKALTKLPAIKNATQMLLCGEDLGMVPACVPQVMNDLGILSLEVQRMPKNPKTEFGIPSKYPYLSVATPSSHDTSTIRGWWEENPVRTQKFYNEILGNYGQAPLACESSIVEQIIIQHLYSPSMWAIFPIQDFFGLDESIRLPEPNAERINQPANPKHYWRYRMHLSLEKLLLEDEFNQKIVSLLEKTGRLDIY